MGIIIEVILISLSIFSCGVMVVLFGVLIYETFVKD